jgi:ABC-type transporter Mla subunit MlaD
MIRENSRAALIQERFPLSDRIIDISPGREPAAVLQEGAALPIEPPLNIDAVVQKALTALDNLSGIVARINAGEGTAGALLTKNELSDQLNAIAAKGSAAMDRLNALLARLNEVSGKANAMADTVGPAVEAASISARDLPAITASVQTMLDTVNAILSQVRSMTGNVAPLLTKGEGVISDAGDVMGAAKRTWPLSSKVPSETEDPPVFIDRE